MLENLENYGPYLELVQTGHITINNTDITKDNYLLHFNSITNILRDGIELEYVHKMLITVHFDVIDVDLYIPDYWFNLIMWQLHTSIGKEIRPKDIFWNDTFQAWTIKNYIDDNFLEENRTKYLNILLNNVIDDCLWNFSFIDEFADYLFSTFNIDDFIDLWKKYPETREIMTMVMDDNVDYKDVMPIGQNATNKLLDFAVRADICIANFARAKSGLNAKQFKEVAVHLGVKPNNKGGVFQHVLNTNFMMGGVKTPIDYYIESSIGRIAQMIVKKNTGESGYFARIIKLNNFDSIIHPNPSYDCYTKNFQEYDVKNEKMLEFFENSWYKETYTGVERLLSKKDKHLVGNKILLRTPMTCASHARGEGICYKCYGNLAYVNNDINAGEIASELLSSVLTQKQLSAKHLLEANILELEWIIEFEKYFQMDYNMFKLQEDIDFTGWSIAIDPEDIKLVSENSEDVFNEYVTYFTLISPDNREIEVRTNNYDNMYITTDLNEIMRKKAKLNDEETRLILSLEHIEDDPLFMVPVSNNDLSRTLIRINGILNKKAMTNSFNRHEILQALIETFIEGGLDVNGVHIALILSNQIRDINNIFDKPDWLIPNQAYSLFTLNQSLTNNPSVTTSLSFEKIEKMLYNPLTFKKNGTSFMDLFFHKQPTKLLNGEVEIVGDSKKDTELKQGLVFRD